MEVGKRGRMKEDKGEEGEEWKEKEEEEQKKEGECEDEVAMGGWRRGGWMTHLAGLPPLF